MPIANINFMPTRIESVAGVRERCAACGADWEQPPPESASDAVFKRWLKRIKARCTVRDISDAAADARNELEPVLQARCAQSAVAYEAAPKDEAKPARLGRHARLHTLCEQAVKRASARVGVVAGARVRCEACGADWEDPPAASASDADFEIWRKRLVSASTTSASLAKRATRTRPRATPRPSSRSSSSSFFTRGSTSPTRPHRAPLAAQAPSTSTPQSASLNDSSPR
jgi:hypothetical protein